MVETVSGPPDADGVRTAARLLHDFNVEYGEPAPHPLELITATLEAAREQGADYALLVTSEDDRLAQRLYEAAGFRRTEGDGGPVMLAYEREL